MPELPEVENVRRQLESLLRLSRRAPPRRLVGVEFFRRDLRFPFSKQLRSRLQSGVALGRLLGLERRAKYLVFRFDEGCLLSHLGMTGSWREVSSSSDLAGLANASAVVLAAAKKTHYERRKHDHVRLNFDQGQSLVFEDPRRFGYLEWADRGIEHDLLKNLGPEPLGPAFTGEYLFSVTRGRTSSIKSLIMDARKVVGVGNIYASEALFRAKIRPAKRAGRINEVEARELVDAIQSVLVQAIAAGGSTIRDFKGADGYRGGFQDLHLVYGRAGELCRQCGTKIVSKQITGRSTFWCPHCQLR